MFRFPGGTFVRSPDGEIQGCSDHKIVVESDVLPARTPKECPRKRNCGGSSRKVRRLKDANLLIAFCSCTAEDANQPADGISFLNEIPSAAGCQNDFVICALKLRGAPMRPDVLELLRGIYTLSVRLRPVNVSRAPFGRR